MEISNVFDVSVSEKWDPMPGTFGGTQDRDPRPMSGGTQDPKFWVQDPRPRKFFNAGTLYPGIVLQESWSKNQCSLTNSIFHDT